MPIKVVFVAKDGKIRTLDEAVLTDGILGALVTTDSISHKIHEGYSYVADVYDTAMSDTDTLNMVFMTPPGDKKIHMYLEFTTLVGGVLELWEDPTWTTNTGTQVLIRNRNREVSSLNMSLLREDKTHTPAFRRTGYILQNVTGLNTASALLIHNLYAWGAKAIGAGTRADQSEFLLKPDTKYACLFTAIGDANSAQITANWYEH